MNKQPELTEADRKAIDELVEKEFFVNARPGLKRGAEWGVKYARAEAIAIIPKANACHLCNYWTREKGCDHRGPDYHYQTEERIFSRINNLEAGIVFHATFERQQAERIAELEAENKAVKEEWAAHIEYHKTVVAKRNELEAEVAALKELQEIHETESAMLHKEIAQLKEDGSEAQRMYYQLKREVQSSVQSPEPDREATIDMIGAILRRHAIYHDRCAREIADLFIEDAQLKSPSLVNDESQFIAVQAGMTSTVLTFTHLENRHEIKFDGPSITHFINGMLLYSKKAAKAAIAKASKEEL
jgi:hypothetical protein